MTENRRLFVAVGLFSAFVNLLMLTGPLFMLQIYDRVLTSRSESTLVAVAAVVASLFLMMGLLDHARARVLARAGARFQARLDARVLGAILTRAGRSADSRSAPATGLSDLEAMQRFASGPGPFAFYDGPWTPIFLAVLFVFWCRRPRAWWRWCACSRFCRSSVPGPGDGASLFGLSVAYDSQIRGPHRAGGGGRDARRSHRPVMV